jgi:hypothetical protein
MKTKLRIGLFTLAVMATIPACTLAQDSTVPSKKKEREVRTLTGCLQKGDGMHNYALTEQDGSKWEIRSATLNLSPHVGHTVTVTGLVSHPGLRKMKEGAKDEIRSTVWRRMLQNMVVFERPR